MHDVFLQGALIYNVERNGMTQYCFRQESERCLCMNNTTPFSVQVLFLN